MPVIIPLNDVPSQTLEVPNLGGQVVQLAVYQEATGLFMDVAVSNTPIISGVICENLNRIVRGLYLGFIGDLAFFDTQGSSDPTTPGLGSRYVLAYYTPAELGGLG